MQHPSRWATIVSIAAKIGCTGQTLNEWVKQAGTDRRRVRAWAQSLTRTWSRLKGPDERLGHAEAEAEAADARRLAIDARVVTLAGVALGVAVTILVWIMVAAMARSCGWRPRPTCSPPTPWARELAARSEAPAVEIAETVDQLGRRGRDAARAARDISASAGPLEGLVAETARLAGSIATAMAQQHETLDALGALFDALTQAAQVNASSAGQLRASLVELSRHAAETRLAVESIAAGSRLGRNA